MRIPVPGLLVPAVLLGVLAAVAGPAAPAAADDPCGPASNPVVCENSKAGTDPSVWDITGAGDESIQGFAAQMSVVPGETVDFKVDTDAAAYSVEIYRSGWYQGLGARHIASVSPSASLPQSQPACMNDLTTGLYDCGNWGVSASWTVPADAVSGVYFALLHRADTDDSSHILFVVREPDAATVHSQVVVQTSDTTWQAYNTYGGSDFYQGAPDLTNDTTGAGRAFKISYNRPVVTREGVTARDFYFSAEFPLVRFLERNGYDVSYLSGVDTARDGSLLLDHEVFVSSGHDEYWSGAQRENVEAARDAGVHLAFFSGNEVYWRTRWEPAVAGPADEFRTLVSYKETWSDAKVDPASEWTGTWRDPRFASAGDGGGLPENGLTGTLYMSNFTDLPVTVSPAEGKLRLWRSTGLDSLAPGAAPVELAAHTVGYESDESPDNGFRPAGLIEVSTTVGAVPEYLQDYGNVVAAGTTTHHTTLYRAASGALVFSAGSVQWSWGLDAEHDGAGAPADARMQQATVNLLADMGAQPATLMAGLVAVSASTDVTGPVVAIGSPVAGASVVNGAVVTVSGTASDVGGVVAGVEVSTDGGTRWHPAAGGATWSYSYVQHGLGAAQVLVRAVDDSVNLGPVASVDVTVSGPASVFGDQVPVVVDSGDASPVELGLRFSPQVDGYVTGVRFYKSAANTGVHTGTLWSAAGAVLARVTFTDETATGWQDAVFTTAVPVTAATTYVISYTAPGGHYALARDAFWYDGLDAAPLAVAGGFGVPAPGVYGSPGSFPQGSYGSSNYFVDALFETTDTAPLTVGAHSPVDGATSVPGTSAVTAVLGKDVGAGTVALSLAADGVAVAGATSYDAATRTVTFVPDTALDPSTTYVATVTATDAVTGDGVTQGGSWSFETAAPDQGVGAPTVSFYDDSAVPDVLDSADPGPVTLGTRFASSVAGTVDGIRFYKGPANTGTHTGYLWRVSDQALLAQVTFTGESAAGWQTAMLGTPVAIDADTEYVVAYRAPAGHYSASVGAFSGAGVSRDPLRTDADSGTYSYPDAYPGASSATSYYVDVVFTRAATPLIVTDHDPAVGAIGTAVDAAVSITVNRALAPGAALSLSTGGAAVAGTSALSADGLTLTFTPAADLQPSTGYTAEAAGLVAAGGGSLADQTWSFTTASGDGCPCTLFGEQTPATAAAADPDAVELGVSFVPADDGLVTGVRFYKGPGNGGTHVGTLWSATGTALATVTFTGESAVGWQTATFATPVEVVGGTTYVVSYLAPQGHYAATSGYFTSDVTVGPLTAPAAGNGRYRYGGGFPTSSWQSTSYLVDVVFEHGSLPAPTVTGTTPADGAVDVGIATPVTATLSAAPATGTPVLALQGPGGAVAGTSTFDAASATVTFTPTGTYPPGATLTASVSLGGTVLDPGGWSFTTAAVPVDAVSLFGDTTPTYAAWDDTSAVQVGTRFQASTSGSVLGIRFYKGAANTGTHSVRLWAADGTLLAQAPSVSESASGWQTVYFATPVAITPGTVYTAAYHSSTGRYAVTSGGLSAVITNGPLSSTAPGGAYVYGTGFPGSSSSAWYGVDLVFAPAG